MPTERPAHRPKPEFGPRVQRNATDAPANRLLERRERRRLAVFTASLRTMMQSREGRFVIWHWLDRMGLYANLWSPQGMEIHRNAAQHELALSIREDIIGTVGYPSFAKMEAEALEWERQTMAELQAQRTQGSTDQPQQE